MEWYLFDIDELLNLQDFYHIVFTDKEYHGILTNSVKNVIKYSNEIIGTLWDYYISTCILMDSWWRHQMETFSALLAICVGNSPVAGEFPAQRPVTRSFDVSFDLRPNKRLSKQSWGWWFETLSCPLWRQRNVKTA